jgi:hypothetical protein
MNKRMRRIGKWIAWILGVPLALLLILFVYLVVVSRVEPPVIADRSVDMLERIQVTDSFYYLSNNWFHQSKSGLFELYTEGTRTASGRSFQCADRENDSFEILSPFSQVFYRIF